MKLYPRFWAKGEPHSLVLPAIRDHVVPREHNPKHLVHAHRCMGVCPQLVEAWFGHDELLSYWDADDDVSVRGHWSDK